MGNCKVIFTIFCLLFIFFGLFFSAGAEEPKITIQEELNRNQPISAGEKIYEIGVSAMQVVGGGLAYVLDGAIYTYMGVEGNNIKVKYKQYYKSNSVPYGEEEEIILTLPLNVNKQTLLKTKNYKIAPSKELLITLADEFYRIKVEGYKKSE